MKYKIIFALFNIVIICSFLFIYLIPLIFLGWGYTKVFWGQNWFLPVFFILIIGLIDTYFLINWKLLQLLEREDWGGLILYLEEKIYKERKYKKRYIKLLINAYLVNSNTNSILRVEEILRKNKPALLRQFALTLGVPHLLKNDPKEMEKYYNEFLHADCKDKDWIQWMHTFSLMLLGKDTEAKKSLVNLSKTSKDPVVLILTAYLLNIFAGKDSDELEYVEETLSYLKKKYSGNSLKREIEKAKGNIQVLILSKVIDEAAEWISEKLTADKPIREE